MHTYEEGEVLAERDYSRNSPGHSTSSRRPSRSAAHPGSASGHRGRQVSFPGVYRLAHRSCPSSKGARPSAQGAHACCASDGATAVPQLPQEAQSVPTFSNARRVRARGAAGGRLRDGGYALW